MERIKWFYWAWRYRLKLERQEIRTLLTLLGPGNFALDISAHKGAYTYWMRESVGNRGKVVAFEPQPRLAARLSRLVDNAGYDNVVVENIGLSSSIGTLMLNIPAGKDSPGASLEPAVEISASGRSFPVEVSTLDKYLETRSTSTVRLIKCDAEGHELEVFRGAEQVLVTQQPVLLFECEARHRQSGRVDDVFSYLEGLGYRGWFLGKDGQHDIDTFDVACHQSSPDDPGYVNNFLFTGSARAGD